MDKRKHVDSSNTSTYSNTNKYTNTQNNVIIVNNSTQTLKIISLITVDLKEKENIEENHGSYNHEFQNTYSNTNKDTKQNLKNIKRTTYEFTRKIILILQTRLPIQIQTNLKTHKTSS